MTHPTNPSDQAQRVMAVLDESIAVVSKATPPPWDHDAGDKKHGVIFLPSKRDANTTRTIHTDRHSDAAAIALLHNIGLPLLQAWRAIVETAWVRLKKYDELCERYRQSCRELGEAGCGDETLYPTYPDPEPFHEATATLRTIHDALCPQHTEVQSD